MSYSEMQLPQAVLFRERVLPFPLQELRPMEPTPLLPQTPVTVVHRI